MSFRKKLGRQIVFNAGSAYAIDLLQIQISIYTPWEAYNIVQTRHQVFSYKEYHCYFYNHL